MFDEVLRHVTIPVAALVFGVVLLLSGKSRTLGQLAIYFGAQTGMNLYMKSVLSSSFISEGKRGMPAAFVVTALQQLTAFVLFAVFLLVSQLTPWPYAPKLLSTRREWVVVLIFASSFVLNIGLNNYSLSLLPISVNLIIRSCLPLSTFISQITVRKFVGQQARGSGSETSFVELMLMIAGVSCAVVAVLAHAADAHGNGDERSAAQLRLGIGMCLLSILSASIYLTFAGLLGSNLQLNALDTTVYMSVPSFVFLIGPIFLIPHPIAWEGVGTVTDWEVLKVVLEEAPQTVWLAVFSGVFAVTYNVLTYKIVQTLSAAHTAFAGSFNNAATIAIALVAGLESMPRDVVCAVIMVLAVVGNISSFAFYNMVKNKHKRPTEPTHLDSERSVDLGSFMRSRSCDVEIGGGTDGTSREARLDDLLRSGTDKEQEEKLLPAALPDGSSEATPKASDTGEAESLLKRSNTIGW
eukprot:TRINITY_DN120923_c0_g1_i1.p1 TRINITY_DN120923_c0_g1~~TRINITY_DN120923_c0_g1_i1.p1  ORF type:complete len:467 (+),score=94.85 TRINITY_DN120923_c0_g1_i1:158-1558(+)